MKESDEWWTSCFSSPLKKKKKKHVNKLVACLFTGVKVDMRVAEAVVKWRGVQLKCNWVHVGLSCQGEGDRRMKPIAFWAAAFALTCVLFFLVAAYAIRSYTEHIRQDSRREKKNKKWEEEEEE